MEIFSNLPEELQRFVLSHSHVMRRAAHAQLELFQSLPPDVQQKVDNDAFSSDDVYDSYNYRCKRTRGRVHPRWAKSCCGLTYQGAL